MSQFEVRFAWDGESDEYVVGFYEAENASFAVGLAMQEFERGWSPANRPSGKFAGCSFWTKEVLPEAGLPKGFKA